MFTGRMPFVSPNQQNQKHWMMNIIIAITKQENTVQLLKAYIPLLALFSYKP